MRRASAVRRQNGRCIGFQRRTQGRLPFLQFIKFAQGSIKLSVENAVSVTAVLMEFWRANKESASAEGKTSKADDISAVDTDHVLLKGKSVVGGKTWCGLCSGGN